LRSHLNDSLNSAFSTATACFDDLVAIRQLFAHPDRPALGMVPIPAIVMAAIDVFANHNIVAIADDNLRRHRDGGRENSTDGRT
jgi:hypothetical protein